MKYILNFNRARKTYFFKSARKFNFFLRNGQRPRHCFLFCNGTFFSGLSFLISLNIFRSMCRTTLIFLLLDRVMSEQHFSVFGHAHICSRKFSMKTWKKVFVKKSTLLSFWRVRIFYSKAWKKWIFWRKLFSSPPRTFF